MSTKSFRQLAGLFFILGAVMVNIPYMLLILNFDYPDILRAPAHEILGQFQAGGSGLVYTWLAFAWVGLPMLLGAIMLKRILGAEQHPYLETATTIGVIGFVVQLIGLLRWVFVVPVLARLHADPAASAAAKETLAAVFLAIHQYGGVVLGEHIGQLFIIVWMSMISAILARSPLFARWVAWLGWIASGVYLLAQTELLATVIPDFPVLDWAGLYGSLLWLLWTIVVGAFLIRSSADRSRQASSF
ncbi:MAG TPA: DUF4386 domain-containing protein [Anaerolineales bacterium]|nr:DUF4386 domain-containing protein [Anaerolineales bacterium]